LHKDLSVTPVLCPVYHTAHYPTVIAAEKTASKEKAERNLLTRLDRLFSKHFTTVQGLLVKEREQRAAEEQARMTQLVRAMHQVSVCLLSAVCCLLYAVNV
jgi:hypothetical protein